MEVTLPSIPVMYVLSENGPQGAAEAFQKVEDALEWKLKGRKFYGVLQGSEYKACVALTDQDKVDKLGLKEGAIPGGKYAKAKIADWEKHLDPIAITFEELKKAYEMDTSRPSIEFYRSQAELILYLPIK